MEAQKQGDIIVTSEGEARIRASSTVIMDNANKRTGVVDVDVVIVQRITFHTGTTIVFYLHSFKNISK